MEGNWGIVSDNEMRKLAIEYENLLEHRGYVILEILEDNGDPDFIGIKIVITNHDKYDTLSLVLNKIDNNTVKYMIMSPKNMRDGIIEIRESLRKVYSKRSDEDLLYYSQVEDVLNQAYSNILLYHGAMVFKSDNCFLCEENVLYNNGNRGYIM